MSWTKPRFPVGLPDGYDMAFVGRLPDLEVLESVWASVCQGNRRVVFVGGEPGVGKTRLVAEAAAAVDVDGAVVLWGASHRDYDVPFRPFVTALEALLDGAEEGSLAGILGDSSRHLLRLTPKIRRHRPELQLSEDTDGEPRLPLFDAVLDLLVALSERHPVAIVLEDLHWASAPTVQLLSHLVRYSANARLLFLITHRTTAPDRQEALTFAIADLYRHAGVSRIDLSGLTTGEVADFLVRQSRMPRAAAIRSAAVLRDQTGGNPFFLQELWQDIAGHGGIEALRSPHFQAPISVRDTLGRRLGELAREHADVLELCAVAGDAVDLGTLIRASVHAPEVTLAAVDLGVSFGIIRSDPSTGECRFAHALARQALLDRLPPSRQVQMHAAVAVALEQRPNKDPATIAELAHHFGRASAIGYADQATDYLVLAAQHAALSLAHEEAAALYARAAELPSTGGHSRQDLLFSSAHSHTLAGDFDDARAQYEELSQAADPDVLLGAAIGYEDTSWRPGTHGERSLELLQAALRGRPADPTDPIHVRALASMARAASFVGDDRQAEDLGEHALALARDLGDQRLTAHALCTTLWRGMSPALAPQLLARSVELSELASRIGDDNALGPAAFYRAVFGYMLGKPEEFERARADLVRTVRSGGEPFYRYVSECAEYACQFIRGQFSDAAMTVATLDQLGAAFGADTAEGSTAIQTFMLRRETTGLEGVRPLMTGTEDLDTHWVPGLLAIYCELELWEPAARALAHMIDNISTYLAVSTQWAGVLPFMIDAAVGLQDETAAGRLHTHAVEYAGLNLIGGQFVAVFGSADRYIARLESHLGMDTAEDRFHAALDMDRRMGAVLHQVETLLVWAEHAERGGGDGNRRATLLRTEARALGEHMGARRSLQRRERRRRPPAPDGAGPDGLTKRELEVLRVVAEGLSNREIGKRLHITQNTAANHVRSILMKTGAPNRTKAAMYAADHHLLEQTP